MSKQPANIYRTVISLGLALLLLSAIGLQNSKTGIGMLCNTINMQKEQTVLQFERFASIERFSLLITRDNTGRLLNGISSYRYSIPSDIPVKYWTVTVYDRAAHRFIYFTERNGSSLYSHMVRKNKDGSADLYFGPTILKDLESNSIQTKPGKSYEVGFCFYIPDKIHVNRVWQLGDIERIDTKEHKQKK